MKKRVFNTKNVENFGAEIPLKINKKGVKYYEKRKLWTTKIAGGGGRLNRDKKLVVKSFFVLLSLVILCGLTLGFFLLFSNFNDAAKGAPSPASYNSLVCTPDSGGYITINDVRQENKQYSVGGIPSGDLVAVCNPGYEFVKWLIYNEGSPSSRTTQTLPSSQRNDNIYYKYEAVFELVGFQINVSTADETMGTVSGSGSFDGVSSTTITATAKSGYSFSHWVNSAGTIVSYNASYTFTVTQSDTYTAVFRAISIVITTPNSGSEIATQTVDKLNTASNFSLTFATNKYINQIKFTGDSLPRAVKNSNGVFTDVADCTAITYYTNTTGSQIYLSVINWRGNNDFIITLYFTNTAQNYAAVSGGGIDTVAVQSTIGGSAELVGDDFANLTAGDTIIIAARLKLNGYKFDGWYVDGVLISSNMSARLTYDDTIKGKVIVAQFSKISSNINDDTNNTTDLI